MAPEWHICGMKWLLNGTNCAGQQGGFLPREAENAWAFHPIENAVLQDLRLF